MGGGAIRYGAPVPEPPVPATSAAPRVLWVLRGLLLIFVLHLVFGDDPFREGIAEREAKGQRLRPQDYAATYTWWMALVNALAVTAALATWRRWWGPAASPENPRFAAPEPRPSRWLVAGVALAMLGLAVTAAPRLSHSLWEDEKYMVVRSIAGQYSVQEDGSLEFGDVPWRDTFFYYRKPNNHVPYSVAARLFHGAWAAVAGPAHELVDERVVRAPALLAGLAGLGSLAWLLWRLGLPLAGLAGAWLLAVHPWYLRYASEVRGYAFLLALLPALVITGLRALERGSWGRWATFALVEGLVLWTYPGALFVLVVANLFLAIEVLRLRGADRSVQLTRFLVANTAAGLAWLQMNLPNMMQFLPYTDSWKGEVSVKLLRQVGSYLVMGMPWHWRREGFVSLETQLEAAPLLLVLVLVGAFVALLLGAGRLARSGSAGLATLAILLIPAPLTVLLAAVRGDHLYPWYLIHALPGVTLLIAAGITLPAAWGRKGRWAAAGLAAVALCAYFAATQPMRSIVRERALQPTRDMVRTVRPNPDVLAVEHGEILTGAVYGPPRYYDPRSVDLPTAEAVAELMQEADRRGLPLYVTYNRPGLAAKRRPEARAMLDREDLFKRIAVLEGVEPKSQHVVFRYRPGAFRPGAE